MNVYKKYYIWVIIYYAILDYVIVYCIVSIILCYIISFVLPYPILFQFTLRGIMLYDTLLSMVYYTSISYTALYHTILCCATLCFLDSYDCICIRT